MEKSQTTHPGSFNVVLSISILTAPSGKILGLFETQFFTSFCFFSRASFRMWCSPSCVTQTVMMSCGRRIHMSTFAWSLVGKEDGCCNRRGVRLLLLLTKLFFWWILLFSADVFEDFISPTTAAQTLLFTACNKRKEASYNIFCLLLNSLMTSEWLSKESILLFTSPT